MKVTYKSIKFDTEQYYKALVTGSDSHHSKTGDSVRQMAATLRDYASGNFMRVFSIDVIWYFPTLYTNAMPNSLIRKSTILSFVLYFR